MADTAVTVVVVAYHGAAWLPACLESLPRAISQPWRLVLVDNAGNNGLDRLPLDNLPVDVVATPHPMGFAEANNLALEGVLPETEAVCFLNQDTRSESEWLDACLTALRSDARLGAVTPLLRTYDGEEWDPNFLTCARVSDGFGEFERTGRATSDVFEVPQATAAALVVRADVLERSGPFDPVFGSYYEDYDLCRRIRSVGCTIGVAAGGTVFHESGSATSSPAAERRRMRWVARNRSIHRIRSAGSRRLQATARELPRLAYDFARGVWGTPSSRPPSVQLAACWDLVRLLPRLVSESRDRFVWRRYLDTLGWPVADEVS